MYIRKSFAVILAIALVFGSFSFSFATDDLETASSNAATFTDLTGHWAVDAINKWAGYGIINGFEGAFRPDNSITRGEMAVILDNMMDYQVKATNKFTDLQEGKFYTEAILKANAAGIINGNGTTVRPNDKITREEAAVMMSRAFAVNEAASGKAFTDTASISAWAKGAVFGMEAKGYISGYNGNFEPKANITRAAVVTMINNIVKAYYTAAGTYTENVNGTAVIKVSGVILKGVTISENLIIAEGVAQGDATLDSVTVKGDTVVRGGGENSVHITGNSNITSVRIEIIGDRVRVVVSDGSTVTEIDVAVGEEIIISGTVGTLNVLAPNTTIVADDANIGTVNVESTAFNTNLQTQSGSVIGTVNAEAQTNVSGQGTVTTVNLNAGADNSSITTPRTQIDVDKGVSGATGGGGTTIPGGSTGTNNVSGNSASVGGSTGGGGGGGHSDPSFSVSNISVINASTITFNTVVAGATIKWNNETLDIVTTAGDNTITVPLMVSGVQNKLEVIMSGYTAFTDSNIVYTESYDKDATLGAWVQDRTDPKTWSEADGWITLETETVPNNNWYAWQGRKSATNIGLTNKWKFETQLELTESMVNRDGIRASVWLQVEGCDNFGEANQSGVIDWAILQFKKDFAADIAGWQYWNSSEGSWNNLTDVATGAGIYTLTMTYDSGTMYQYINGSLVNSYDIDAQEEISAPTHIILQSYSFGESYTAKWKVPTVKYLNNLPADAKIITDVDDLTGAIDTQAAGETWIIISGTYPLTEQFDIVTPLTIEGYGSGPIIIKSDNASWSTTNGEKHLFAVYDGTIDNPVSIKNIVFDANSQSYGINTYDNAYCLLEDVTIRNSKGAGLTVNGSTVIAENLNTNNNAWGGVNVDPGSGVNTPSTFTLTGNGVLSEETKIWSDGAHVTDTATVTVNAAGYTWANPYLGIPGLENFKHWSTLFDGDIARTFANIAFVRMSDSYISAEFSLKTSTLADLTGIQWELYDDDELLAVNKAVRGDVDSTEELIWTDLDGARTNISCPFRTTIEDDGYWEYGAWDGTAPTKAVLTLTYTSGATVIIEQSGFTGDKIKPVLQEAIRSGNTIELVFDKELHSAVPAGSNFEVLINNSAAEIDDVYTDSNVVVIQVSDDSTILSSDLVQVSYNYQSGTAPVQDTFNNKAENFSLLEVACVIFEDQYEEEEFDETFGKDHLAINITTDGEAQTHTIAPIQDTDVLYFNVVEGSTYTIKTSNLNNGLYADHYMDTVIWLTTTSGIVNLDDCIFDDDGGEEDLSSKIVWTADTTGTCFIFVQHYYYDGYYYKAGSYDISVTEEPAVGLVDMMRTLESSDAGDRGPLEFNIDVTKLPRLPKSN